MLLTKPKNKVWIVDCLGGLKAVVTTTTFNVGNSPDSDMVIDSYDSDTPLIRIESNRGEYSVKCGDGLTGLIIDGQHEIEAKLGLNEEHTVVVNGFPFVLKVGNSQNDDRWLYAIDPTVWHVYQRSDQKWVGPITRQELPLFTDGEPGDTIIMCAGMEQIGFYPHQVMSRMANVVDKIVEPPSEHSEPVQSEEVLSEVSEVNADYGEFTCPICWLRFDRGDIMNISVHASLRGDPVLGEEHMQRFLASSFNDRGQAVDAMGLPAPEKACPHCRRKLPPGFVDQPHYIFSIVGAPSSGKSYYLSVLVKVMQDIAFKSFAVTFRDAAPADNAVLNDMRNHLFSACSPEEAYLAKTDLEGALYETLPRQGRQVRLPKPFIFGMSDSDREEEGFSIIFYDNAGEHFEPGRNSADSPGAQHIAVASGIFFLFDPLYNPQFRRKLGDHSDPQLEQRRNDQQDILLAECEARIKEIAGLSSKERVSTPLSVIVGKSDAWLNLLGDEPLMPIMEQVDGSTVIRLDHIKANSDRIREFMLDVCPSIVANAEAISSEVMYFASSPLGHAPVSFKDDDGLTRIGPDPEKLDPQRVEDPVLWSLSKIAPEMFPSQP